MNSQGIDGEFLRDIEVCSSTLLRSSAKAKT